jgi:DNA-directed RNA polymerase subunit N (RpoN/RPB10)
MNTIIKVFPKYCSCCRKLGELQQKYEEKVEKYLNEGSSISISQQKVCKDLDIKMMCCLNNTYNASTYYVVDTFFNMVLVNGSNIKNIKSENGLKTLVDREIEDFPLL